jgi:hypothetical protein
MDLKLEASFPDDADWDAKYFGLIFELAEKNASRYELQTAQLLTLKSMEITVNGIHIKYKLERRGCSYSVSEDRFSKKSWIRMGWGKSSKRRALPNFFAKSEADVLLESQR